MSAVVHTSPPIALLFLNNNLHHTHHTRPDAAWYRLPELNHELGSDAIAAAGAGLYRGGYAEQWRRFGVRPFCRPVFPGSRTN
jgi:fatty acid desaturase